MTPTEYNIHDYMFDSYDWVADGYVEQVNSRTYQGYTEESYSYVYAYLYELTYDSGTLYTEVVSDVNKYLNYLTNERNLEESFASQGWILSGVTYETTHEINLTNGDTIHFGIDYYESYYNEYCVTVLFVYEDVFMTGV